MANQKVNSEEENAQNLPAVAAPFVVDGLDLTDAFKQNGFEEQTLEFFSLDDTLIGVELETVMAEISHVTIKEVEKEFVKIYVRTESGHKVMYAGQAKLISTFKRVDKGKGVLAYITFLGKIKLAGTSGKTMNDFRIKTKSL